jgi:hypothetical protein
LSLVAPHLKDKPLTMTVKLRDNAAAELTPAQKSEVDERIKQWHAQHDAVQ